MRKGRIIHDFGDHQRDWYLEFYMLLKCSEQMYILKNPYSKKKKTNRKLSQILNIKRKSYWVTCSLLLWKSMKHPKLVLLLCLKIKGGGWPSHDSHAVWTLRCQPATSCLSGHRVHGDSYPVREDLTRLSPLVLERYYLYITDLNQCISIF